MIGFNNILPCKVVGMQNLNLKRLKVLTIKQKEINQGNTDKVKQSTEPKIIVVHIT